MCQVKAKTFNHKRYSIRCRPSNRRERLGQVLDKTEKLQSPDQQSAVEQEFKHRLACQKYRQLLAKGHH